MTDDRSSAGDPARTLSLLWGGRETAPRRGPQRRTDVGAIIDAAVALADEDGLRALTMRAVAERVGLAVMSLYTYVADRAELLDLMLDTVYAAMPRRDTTGLPWPDRVRQVALENDGLYRAHPWAATVATLRPPLGPGQMAKYEHELAAFDECGLDDVTVDDCLTHVLVLVRSCARDAADARDERRDSGVTDEQWWDAAGPLLSGVLDPRRYPRATRIGTAAGTAHGSAHDVEHAFEFGLALVLDGLAALVDKADRQG